MTCINGSLANETVKFLNLHIYGRNYQYHFQASYLMDAGEQKNSLWHLEERKEFDKTSILHKMVRKTSS